MPHTKRFIATAAIFAALSAGFSQAAFSQDASQGCKAPPIQQSPDAKKTGQAGDITGSTTLSDCGGVIKPPDTGDSTLVQPAPPASNMPVVKPKDLPAQQQNAK